MRGVTYGPFAPGESGCEYPAGAVLAADFARMAACGINAVRTYTVPPRRLLDAAAEHGLRVMVGAAWEQHVAFLGRRKLARDIAARVREGVAACAGHPAVLCYAVGNEIPANIVRWYGHRRVERFIAELFDQTKSADPAAPVTYVNYPSTEYLDLPFLDLVSFNVYLETEAQLRAYLAHLQNIAADRPLLIAEMGLDARRNGQDGQACAVTWQVREAFAGGCAGAFLFAWTDEWHRGGQDILDWNFGLTRRDRTPKPALSAAADAFEQTPFPADTAWPSVSVVVCTYNGGRTLRGCLEALRALDYPDYEVIVVDDGSTDDSGAIAAQFDVRLISTENRGLSHARNTGLDASRGEIVAYTDDDTRPDTQWLRHLAWTFLTTGHAGVGGPNVVPEDDPLVAQSVARSPGRPTHVLLTDDVAEHIPGCNMAFRRRCLHGIGGFDATFRVAGDDVDVCWRLQDQGWTLGFSPGALVWHHHRATVGAYWRQQTNYGRAEAMLERKWPHKYNFAGHPTWAGRMYERPYARALGWSRRRIYHGVWGSALFQSVYHAPPSLLASLPLMPEWFLLLAGLAGCSLLGLIWKPMLVAVPLLVLALAAAAVQVGAAATQVGRSLRSMSRGRRWKILGLVASLHVLQPLARLRGRAQFGLTPWRRRRRGQATAFVFPCYRTATLWSVTWRSGDARLEAMERALKKEGWIVLRGGAFDRWDLEVHGGVLGAARLRLLAEEHGQGRQLVRLAVWPKHVARLAAALLVPCGLFAALGIVGGEPGMAVAALLYAAAVLAMKLYGAGTATASVLAALAKEQA